jgi:hypothetical protein
MALISVDGIYKDGRVELAERPEGVEGPARVIVTFLPTNKPKVPGQLPPREGGQLKGKIWIADDFDELPKEIAEAFGIEEP